MLGGQTAPAMTVNPEDRRKPHRIRFACLGPACPSQRRSRRTDHRPLRSPPEGRAARAVATVASPVPLARRDAGSGPDDDPGPTHESDPEAEAGNRPSSAIAPTPPDASPRSIEAWTGRAQVSIYAHNLAGDHFSRRNGIVNAISLGGVVLLGQIALIADLSSKVAQVVTATLTVALALLGALALLWDYRAKAQQHRFAARQYGMIRRSLEALLEVDPGSDEARWRREELRRDWDVASSTAPNPPDRFREQARQMSEDRRRTSIDAMADSPRGSAAQ
jgi:hypothetical protein